MKKSLILFLIIPIILINYSYKKISSSNNHIVIEDNIEDPYFKEYNGEIYNRQDILNYIYYIVNSGSIKGTATCSISYSECINDFIDISSDKYTLSLINNFTHPYNSFETMSFKYNYDMHTFTVSITKRYNQSEIADIDYFVSNKIIEITNDNMNNYQKIKAIQNYLINNSKYHKNDPNNNYNTASSILFNGNGNCKAYTDTMSIFLYKLNITNYEIGNDKHIWNLIYIDNNWYHLDVTWNISSNKYFLINNDTLNRQDKTLHYFDKLVFKEAI